MNSAPLPQNEAKRLEALKALGILNTNPDERFYRITRTAQLLFDVDIASINLIDKDNQWFYACRGLDIAETSRDISFCSHTILENHLMIVDDTHLNNCFADNPLVTGAPYIRFYAGMPVHGPGGYKVGTLCIIDSQPRSLSDEEQQALIDLAAWVEMELNAEGLGDALLSLKRQQQELEKLNHDLENFVFMVAHDLKQPSRTVRNFIEHLGREYGESLDAQGKEWLQFAGDGAKRMTLLIDNLLKYGSVGNSRGDFVVVELSDIVNTVIDDLKLLVEEERAEINAYFQTLVISGDPLQLHQLFLNLIENAIKFKKPTETPRIDISNEAKKDEWVFTVKDNGIGISMQDSETIFKAFQQLQPNIYPGIGIGLAICKKILDFHGGRIWVESNPGAGSCFKFTIPCTKKVENG